jgi:hypothetical protein
MENNRAEDLLRVSDPLGQLALTFLLDDQLRNVLISNHEKMKTNTLTSIAVWISFTSFAHRSMVRKIALMFLTYIFHVAVRISNKLDWIFDMLMNEWRPESIDSNGGLFLLQDKGSCREDQKSPNSHHILKPSPKSS